MRKQYHLWKGDEGYDAWEVDRLVELTSGRTVSELDLGEIWEVDSEYWFDPDTDPPTVRAVAEHAGLMMKADLSYPIILGPDKRVMDGMHRVARALLEGRKTIRAVQLDQLPDPDFTNCRPEDLPYDTD